MTQVIQTPHGISTHGSCVVRVEADYATLDFRVTQYDGNALAASSKARTMTSSVRGLLVKTGVEDRNIRPSRVELLAVNEGKKISYQAEIRFNVMVRDIERVEGVVAALAEAGVWHLDNLRYRTSRLREARAEARQGAILAAIKKAELYTEAVGVGVGRVIHIEEVPESELTADMDEFDEFQTSGTYNPSAIAVRAAVHMAFAIKGGTTSAATGQFVAFDPR